MTGAENIRGRPFSCPLFQFLSDPIHFHARAAAAPPASGATMNSHSWDRALPPSKIAGPMLLAGLTEVPVIGMQTMWMSTRVRPMASPAKLPAPFLLSVEPSTTSTKMNV